MEEISLQELYFIIRKRLGMIALLTVISIIIAGIFSFFILKPEYEAFTTIMAGKPRDIQSQTQEGIEYDDLVLNQKLVHTYGALIESRDVADKVIENLDLDIDFKSFGDKISVNLVEDTEVIRITARDSDPVLAAEIANETATVFMDSVVKFMNLRNVQVIDKAQEPDRHIKPRPTLNMAIAGVLGIMLGIFITFLLEFLDQTIKTPEDVEKHLELSNLGSIPKVGPREIRLVSLFEPKSPVTEAFRTLRTNIHFSSVDKELQTLVVTSSTPEEGKSTIASNIAGTIAQEEKNVLLIDCDLRKPSIHDIFIIRNSKGLTNILVGDSTVEEITCKYEKLKNLHIITSGPIPPNPAELLSSNKMKEFIEEMKKEYDMVILDSPPTGVVTDSAILSTRADGLILVAAVAETDIEEVVRSKESLDKVKSNIIGTVLNKVPIDDKSYYGYGYYGYYGEEPSKRRQKSRAK